MQRQIKVNVKLFSHLRYILGKEELFLNLKKGTMTDELEKRIRKMGGKKIEKIPFRIALNMEFIGGNVELQDGDEIAFIPPVQGG
jgi:molybdopterin converting factor small subunit